MRITVFRRKRRETGRKGKKRRKGFEGFFKPSNGNNRSIQMARAKATERKKREIFERMKEIVVKACNISMFDKIALVAAIDQEAKGNHDFLDALIKNPSKLNMGLAFVPLLVQIISERDLRRFEMAFETGE
jgi:hypothetical protein